ncbi:MAG TPA: TonB-dependent receptor, partial [Draconibacterium sp.]|nr:TonB-dependent receptor [Draconibacterium sp.]
MKSILIILLFSLYSSGFIFGQEKKLTVYLKKQNTGWEEFVKKIEQENNVRFFYEADSIPKVTIVVEKDSLQLEEVLRKSFAGYGLSISSDQQGNYFIFKNFVLKPSVNSIFAKSSVAGEKSVLQTIADTKTEGVENDYLKTYQEFIAENLIVGSNGHGNKTQKVKVNGKVTNADDGTPLPQARLFIPEINKNFISNISGYYEMELLPGNYTLVVSSLGMYEKSIKLTILSSGEADVQLHVKSFLLNEATVTGMRNENISAPTMGVERLTQMAIKELPVVLGEKDVVKIVLLLPGVQSVGEISSGFNVRGSPSDQNMFYINDLPVYNSSHLFGLFTTFNSDAIGEFKFYKNSIPIEYGGQLSSIFDIDVKKGNNKNFSAMGGIGLTSARVLAEGPLEKEKSSYLVSFRSSYSDWLLNQVDNLDVQNSAASFQDALMDFSLQLNNSNKLGLFFYGSRDYADLAFGIENEYSNLGADIKWTHTFNEKLSSELNFAKSQYAYEEANTEIEYLANKHSFDLNHNELKLSFRYKAGAGHNLQLGLNSKFIRLNYGDFLPLNDQSSVEQLSFEPEQSINNGIFAGDTWEITPRLTLDAGVRGTLYMYLGPKTVYSYLENEPVVTDNITGSEEYGKNEIINNYRNLDVLLSSRFEVVRDFSLKASYSRLHQYTYMLSNTVSVSPISKWKLSDPHLKPMSGNQFSFGLYKNLWRNKIEASVEMYYKEVENLVEYKDGAEFVTNQIPETNIIQGDLQSYGIEFMVKKKMDNLNGWINYT